MNIMPISNKVNSYLGEVTRSINRPYVKKSQNDRIAILDFRLIT